MEHEVVWARLPDAFDRYEVCSTGKVRTRGLFARQLAVRTPRNGAPTVTILLPGPKGLPRAYVRSLPRIVASVFVPNPDNLPVLRHKDGDQSNCAADNLEWADYERKARPPKTERAERMSLKRAMDRTFARIEQQEMLDKMGPMEQRAFFISAGKDSKGLLARPNPGVILKPLDIDPSRFSDYEKTLIRHGHVTYPPDSITVAIDKTENISPEELHTLLTEGDLPQPEQPE